MRESATSGKALSRSGIVKRFAGRASRSMLYEWIATFIEETSAREKRVDPAYRRAGVIVINAEKAVEDESTAMPADPAAVARELTATVVPAEAAQGGAAGRALPILEHLHRTIEDVLRVRAVAFHADGRVRNSRMVLKAAEEMRRSLETVVKLQAAMNDQAALERFHAAIIEVIQQESPDLAQRVLRRLDELAMRWGA